MKDTELKELLADKKDSLMKSVKNILTYDKWDKKSPVWAYVFITGDVEEISDIKRIKYLLTTPQAFVKFFANKEDMETYKWMHDLVESEIDARICEGFGSGYFDNFVDVKDITGTSYYVTD